MNRRIKVLMLTPFPYTEEEKYQGGVIQVAMRLSESLSQFKGIKLYVASKSEHVNSTVNKKIGNLEVIYYPRLIRNIDWFFLKTGMFISVRKIINKIQPDIIHCQGQPDLILTALRFPKIPNVVTVHGIHNHEAKVRFDKPGLKQRLETFFVEKCEIYNFKRIQNLICISEEIQTLTKKYNPSVNTFEIENPIDSKFFHLQKIEIGGKQIILFVAAIVKRKGLHFLLDAASRLIKEGYTLEIRIAGIWNWDREYVASLMKQYHILIEKGFVYFMGGISQEELYKEFSKATLLVLPSLSESKPMVISQAMAARVPVIATNVGGIPEMIKNNHTGLLVRPSDSVELCNAIKMLLDNVDLRKNICANAFLLAQKKYFPEAVALKTINAYKDILGHPTN